MNADVVPLEIETLSAGYGERVVVREASFGVGAGELVAVLGANGSGKTTLLKACIGLLPAMGGSARLSGKDPAALGSRERARLAAWVPQLTSSAWSFTVREVVAQGRYASLGPFGRFGLDDRAAVDAALETLDVSDLASRDFSSLSGGEGRRVLIARAVAQDAPLLALDEPAAHLDPGRQVELMETLRAIAAAGRGVVVSVHDVNAARRFADRVLLLGRDGSSAFGTPDEALAPGRIEDAYETEFLHAIHADYGRFVLPLARRMKGKPT